MKSFRDISPLYCSPTISYELIDLNQLDSPNLVGWQRKRESKEDHTVAPVD